MFAAWTAEARDGRSLERMIEAHLNEFAGQVISASYHVSESGIHRALVVYVELKSGSFDAEAVAVAELIVDERHT